MANVVSLFNLPYEINLMDITQLNLYKCNLITNLILINYMLMTLIGYKVISLCDKNLKTIINHM